MTSTEPILDTSSATAPIVDAAVRSGEPPKPEMTSTIYGTFHLAGSEFALAVDAIQEVVNEPAHFEPIPLSPDYILGLFNLRGVIVPVVDLRTIFHLQTDEKPRDGRKVAIVEYGNHCIGLIFDGTGDVFNGKYVEHSKFSRDPGDPRETIVDGVFKMENGERLVQVLDPFELLKLDRLPRAAGAATGRKKSVSKGHRKQCISFTVGDCLCALDMNDIKEIIQIDQIDNTALAHGFTLGAINLRGKTVPVVDFPVYLGNRDEATPVAALSAGKKVIVMKVGEEFISLLVDNIEDIISYYNEDILSFPAFGTARGDLVRGCLSNNLDKTVMLLEHQKILTDEELVTVTRGHSKLFRADSDGELSSMAGETAEKKTYITFSVDTQYAVEMMNVNEVISFPEKIVHPPSTPRFIEGMVNLRGELIPIINPRSLYELDLISAATTKVLVFTVSDKKYGIMVDSVDAIVSFAECQSLSMPSLGDGEQSRSLTNDAKEALFIKRSDGADQSLLVLDLESLAKKAFSAF